MFDGKRVVHFEHRGEPFHEAGDVGPAEAAHQVIFERKVEAAGAGVALAGGAATQLVVNAPRVVPLGADDVQAANRPHLLFVGHVLAEGLRVGLVNAVLAGIDFVEGG